MISLVAAAAVGMLATAPVVPRSTYAIIVANNQPQPGAEDLPPLRYADDDGARFYELFELFSKRVVIHSVLDAESQDLHPEVTEVALPPTLADVDRTLDSLFADIKAARQRGEQTELFFVFVGHGSALESGEGVMHFLDGGFTRGDLFQRVISRSPATTNHILVDACNAFLFVAGRGDATDASIDRAVDQYLARETMKRHPNTGFLLSTSASTEVHEWSGFRAGVFSHEVRSALLGGADVNGDGAVTYNEVSAFLNAANGRVTDPRAKLDPWVAPPAIRQATPLVERDRAPSAVSTVRVSGEMAGRWSLEDSRGVRLADLNVAPDGPVTMLLSAKRNHVLKGTKVEIELPSTVVSQLEADQLASRTASLGARGVSRAFREDLFAIAFGRAFYDGFRVSMPPPDLRLTATPVPDDPTTRRWIGGGLVAVGVAVLATSVAYGVMARNDASAFREGVGLTDDVTALRNRASDRQTISNVLIGVGVATGLAGTALLVW